MFSGDFCLFALVWITLSSAQIWLRYDSGVTPYRVHATIYIWISIVKTHISHVQGHIQAFPAVLFPASVKQRKFENSSYKQPRSVMQEKG